MGAQSLWGRMATLFCCYFDASLLASGNSAVVGSGVCADGRQLGVFGSGNEAKSVRFRGFCFVLVWVVRQSGRLVNVLVEICSGRVVGEWCRSEG